MRVVVSLLSLCIIAGCASVRPDPDAETAFYDSRTTTGSNIPRKNTGAVIVDKRLIEDSLNRQGGSIQR